MCLIYIYIYICIVVECKKVKMDKYELLFTHTINLLEMGCEVNFKYPFCNKRWQPYPRTIRKIVTFQQEIAWKLTKCLSSGSIRGGRYNGMVLFSLLFLFQYSFLSLWSRYFLALYNLVRMHLDLTFGGLWSNSPDTCPIKTLLEGVYNRIWAMKNTVHGHFPINAAS